MKGFSQLPNFCLGSSRDAVEDSEFCFTLEKHFCIVIGKKKFPIVLESFLSKLASYRSSAASSDD